MEAEAALELAARSNGCGAAPALGAPPNAAYDASGNIAAAASATFTKFITLLQENRSEHGASGALLGLPEKSE
jgi:hypothetical protein